MGNNVKSKDSVSFSKSSLDMIMNCPLQYHYSKERYLYEEEYILKDSVEWLKANEKGIFAHSVLEKYVSKYLKGKKNYEIPKFDLESFNNIFKECQLETEKSHPAYSKGEKDKFISDSKKSLEQYLRELHKELQNKDNKWVIAETELDVKNCPNAITIDGNTFNINYHGVIDRIDVCEEKGKKYARIIDYKTASKDNFIEFKNAENTTQHHIYKLLVETQGYEVLEFDYVFIFDDDKVDDKKVIKIDKSKLENPIDGSLYPRAINDDGNVLGRVNLKDIIKKVFVDKNYMIDELDNLNEEKNRCKNCNYKNVCIKRMR